MLCAQVTGDPRGARSSARRYVVLRAPIKEGMNRSTCGSSTGAVAGCGLSSPYMFIARSRYRRGTHLSSSLAVR